MSKCFLPLFLIIIVSCHSSAPDQSSVTIYDSLFTNKVDLVTAIRDTMRRNNVTDYRIIPKHIKEGHFIGLVRPDDDRDDLKNFYLLVYDLRDRELLYLIPNPFEELDVHQVEFDYADNKIYAAARKGLNKVIYYDCGEKSVGSIRLPDDLSPAAAGSLVVHNNHLFFTHSPLGSLVYSLSKNKGISSDNDYGNTVSYIYAETALPLSIGLNLISGKRAGDKITATVLDSSLAVRCSFSFDDDNPASTGQFKMLAFDSVYAIFNRRACQLVSKRNCETRWSLAYDRDFQHALQLSGENMLCVVSDARTTGLLNLETKTGTIRWQNNFPVAALSNKNITINSRQRIIVVAGKDTAWTLNYEGKTLNAYRQRGPADFETLVDLVNNDHVYMILNDGLIYW